MGRVSLSLSMPPCVCVCVCMHMSVCLPLTIFKSVSDPSCISGSVSLETGPPFPSSGPGLSLVLILTLADELALAGCLIWHGCVLVTVHVPACCSSALSGRPCTWKAAWGKVGLGRAIGRG